MEGMRNKLSCKNELGRALLGEFTGTMLLLFIGNSVVAQQVLAKDGRGGNDMIGVNVGFALAIAFGVAVCAKLSGGHINPAVSLMFLSFKQLAPVRFVLYFIVQLLGAFCGAALTWAIYHDAINTFDTGKHMITGAKATAGIFASYPGPHLGMFNGFIDQMLATAVFCFLIAHLTDKRNAYPSWAVPFLVGLAFLAIGTAFGFNCGYPCNPARDLGPRLFTFIMGYGGDVFSHKGWFWVPIVAPFVGALIGAWFYQFAIGFHTPADEVDKYVIVGATTQEMRPLAKEFTNVNA
ncbi:hypothetical protein PFISCL1PPCAC_7932 [Pristionchus fissidentatus]|uniref:Uncharacterized protein n=1 Tax=Pristionchus fissidentatus TaxID=1538716 RepID=A0AAV5VFD2_9BILA|nr:hypothetical protein PFISCL1PPCAC_7932 [Pristionchus fissidentatus]